MENIPQNIEDLREAIRKHNFHYHVEDNPIISDREYDAMFDELLALEKQYPEFVTADSPTQKLHVEVQKGFKTAKHYMPLLSLSNTYNAEDLKDFDARVKRLLKKPIVEDLEYDVELKYDGLSIGVVYENGVFTRATTRGNGEEGENVTENIKTVRNVPLKLLGDEVPTVMEIRGEVLMSKENFRLMNEERAKAGEKLYANPRNSAAGAVRQLDPNMTRKRNLHVIFYDITHLEGMERPASHKEEMDLLASFGLTSSEIWGAASISEVISLTSSLEPKREDYHYEIDGLVIKLSDSRVKEQLGYTEHHPRGAIAFKFPAQEEITQVEKIDVQVGRTGVLTPVAHLVPVNVGGVTVSRATLHNMEDLQSKDVREGDFVVIKRAGEVIPYIVKPVVERREKGLKPYAIPTTCPVCKESVVTIPGEVALRCVNLTCPAQVVEGIKYFVSKQAMDIDGLGEKYIETLVEQDIVQDVADLYGLKDRKQELIDVLYEDTPKREQGALFEDLENMDYLKTHYKLVHKLLTSIEESKQQDVDRLLTGLGIKYVGKKTAKILKEDISEVWDLVNRSTEELLTLDGIGPKVAESIADYLTVDKNVQLLKKLEEAGVNMVKKGGAVTDGPLAGKTFLFTGTLEHYSRDEAGELVESLGGKQVSSISKKTDYLVAGAKAGSKLKKAEALGVTVLSEEEFRKMVP